MFQQMSIKWKILLIALLGPVLVAAVMAWQQVMDIRASEEDALLQQARTVVMMAEAARQEMAQKLQDGVVKPFDQIPEGHLMDAVPVVSAMQLAAQNAEQSGYRFRVPKVSPRNPDNTPTELELGALKKLKAENLPELVLHEDGQIRYFRPIKLTQDCLACHGDPKGSADPIGGTREGWRVGEIHGAFEIVQSLDRAEDRVLRAQATVAGWTVAVLAIVFFLTWWVAKKSVVHPLLRIQAYAGDVASGRLDAEPKGSFGAELAKLKEAIQSMVGRLKEQMAAAQAKSKEAKQEAERAEQAMLTAQQQGQRVSTLLEKMTTVAGEASEIAHQVASASEELSAQVDMVSKGAGIQSERTEQTATAMEEMNATVMEVARSSGSAAESADKSRMKAQEGEDVVEHMMAAIKKVNDRTQQLKGEMSELGRQANDINKILDVISEIADQTNLLALNAAIEAARAGEAGRGFAVVADEVRKLAEKTMLATKEVGEAISAIQDSANTNIESMDQAETEVQQATNLAQESGSALREIVSLAHNASDQVRSIAASADQQSAASEEINRAVDDISRITTENAVGASESAQAVTELAELALKLQNLIDQMAVNE
ncbi:MAG: methyl-accepting chemotaxis protein [Desulfovibrionaceae bacterium]